MSDCPRCGAAGMGGLTHACSPVLASGGTGAGGICSRHGVYQGRSCPTCFERRVAEDLEPNELIRIRARLYRVAGFNAYGQAMLEEVRNPRDGEYERATDGFGIR